MATHEPAEPQQPINKTWVLRTSIHCEGCKKKVKKILNQVHGVENVDVDIKQQKVIVTGNVDGVSLVKKLIKSGKNAELWPQKTAKKERKTGQEKHKEKVQTESPSNEPRIDKNGAKKEQKPQVNVQMVKYPAKITDGGASTSGSAPKNGEENGDAAPGEVKSNEKSDACGGQAAPSKVSEGGSVKTTGSVQVADPKTEEKKPESSPAGAPPPPAVEEKVDTEGKSGVAAEKSNGDVGGAGPASGHSGKKKKRQGQNGDTTECAKSSAATPASTGSENHHEASPPPISIPANHIPARQHDYSGYPPRYYSAPPVYAVNYNTSNPTSSYTASYYAAAPPYSYAYTYSAREIDPPPPPADPDSHQRQPLDSFEMFSDENPNGCFIM